MTRTDRRISNLAPAALLMTATIGLRAVAADSATGLVDVLNGVFGPQHTNRAIHAKGVVLEGNFSPTAEASMVSVAAHFRGKQIPILVRFSNFAGIPTLPDTDGLATPRGIGIKFTLPDGTATDIVAHSFNGFPTKTAADFRDLMLAVGASPPGTPAPTAMQAYLSLHPAAMNFFTHLPPPPQSFATVAYYGVNSFKFTDADGKVLFARYQIVPSAGVRYLPQPSVAKAAPDYLRDEIQRRVSARPVTFTLRLQLAAPEDAIDDPSVAWPDSRRTINLGEIRLNRVRGDSDTLQQQLLFNPAALTSGIASADPMIEARSAAYAVSYARRHNDAAPSPHEGGSP